MEDVTQVAASIAFFCSSSQTKSPLHHIKAELKPICVHEENKYLKGRSHTGQFHRARRRQSSREPAAE